MPLTFDTVEPTRHNRKENTMAKATHAEAIKYLLHAIECKKACLRQAKEGNGVCECRQTTASLTKKLDELKHSISVLELASY